MNMQKVRKIGSTRTYNVPRVTADALVRRGKFEYAQGSVPSTKPTFASRAENKRRAKAKAQVAEAKAQVSTQVQEPLEDKTKAQLVDYLRDSGQKVDQRLSKDDLLKQAKRYQRRDMRAAE